MEIEDPIVEGKVFRPFIRARMEIDIQYPLSTGCWFPRKKFPRVWVFVNTRDYKIFVITVVS